MCFVSGFSVNRAPPPATAQPSGDGSGGGIFRNIRATIVDGMCAIICFFW